MLKLIQNQIKAPTWASRAEKPIFMNPRMRTRTSYKNQNSHSPNKHGYSNLLMYLHNKKLANDNPVRFINIRIHSKSKNMQFTQE